MIEIKTKVNKYNQIKLESFFSPNIVLNWIYWKIIYMQGNGHWKYNIYKVNTLCNYPHYSFKRNHHPDLANNID